MSDTKTERAVAPKQLIALVRDATQKREKIASIAGDLGERVRLAVENGHLHRGAFAQMVRLNKMEETKRNDFLRSFALYADHCSIELWGGTHTGDLDDMARKSETEEQAAVDEQMRQNGEHASGIQPLDPEKHEENQKPKRRRPRKDAEPAAAQAEPATSDADLSEEDEAEIERGRIAYLDGKPGILPDDLIGETRRSKLYLMGWSEEAKKNGQKQAAGMGDAPGSYQAH